MLLLFENQVKKEKYHDGPDCTGKNGTKPACSQMDTQFSKKPVTNETSKYTYNDITNQAQSTPAVEQAAQPTGQATDD